MFAVAHDSRLARRATSTTSSTRRRSCCSTGRTRSPARIIRSSTGKNLIWPPVAAFLVSPLTVLSPGAADWAIALLGLAAALLSLRIVGVRDWRVYGAFALWPPVIGEIRVSHLTPFLCVLVALAWRYRDVRFAPGLAVGARRRREVLPLAARRLARRDRQGARDARRRRVSPPPRSSSSSRSRGSTTTSARCSSSETRSTRTATRRSGSSCRSARRSGSRAPRRS